MISLEAEGAKAPAGKLALTHCLRDETRAAYILQAVESAWEGVDRQKATDAKGPPAIEDPCRADESTSSAQAGTSVEEEVRV